ncbi:hypothetical protein SDC9_110571 [bioreactor metagenome]|uniref:Uncharacterized protein n=1 Tax=bioreactor metagenome TaxID=1076179 RepID=A0A645BE14_9ZZZZ
MHHFVGFNHFFKRGTDANVLVRLMLFPEDAGQNERGYAAELVRALRTGFEFVLDHPALEAVGAFRNDPDFVLVHIVEMVFHLGGKELCANARAALEGHGVVAHADLFVDHAAVDDAGDFAVHAADEQVFVLHAVAQHAQQFRNDARRNDIVKVFFVVEENLNAFQHHRGLFTRRFSNQHILAGGQRNHFGFIVFQSDCRRPEFGFHFIYGDIILAHVWCLLIVLFGFRS